MIAIVRQAQVEDAERLALLRRETFRETFVDGGFAIPYPPADLAEFERATYGQERVTEDLRDPEKMSWVAEADGHLLGYAHVGPCKLPHPDVGPGDGELYQLYVRKASQGMRLGGRLLTTALDFLARHRPGPVWVGVWSGNARAQMFYEAHGFIKVGEYDFPVGTWRDREFICRRAG
ncbi:MAG: N-acetyltransferase family protein [Sphingomonadaceae bacterium]